MNLVLKHTLTSLLVLLAWTGLAMADNKVNKITWSDLIPEGHEPEKLLEKYEKDIERLNNLPEDSEEGLEIIERIQAELDASPMNTKLNQKTVKLEGYIAPLDIKDGLVSRFLLVPYFGACIHVPPPPLNQTVLVEALPKQGIPMHRVENAFIVTGTLLVKEGKTDIGNAGYHIIDAKTELYKDTVWLQQ